MTLYPDSRISLQATHYSSVEDNIFFSLQINCNYVLQIV